MAFVYIKKPHLLVHSYYEEGFCDVHRGGLRRSARTVRLFGHLAVLETPAL